MLALFVEEGEERKNSDQLDRLSEGKHDDETHPTDLCGRTLAPLQETSSLMLTSSPRTVAVRRAEERSAKQPETATPSTTASRLELTVVEASL